MNIGFEFRSCEIISIQRRRKKKRKKSSFSIKKKQKNTDQKMGYFSFVVFFFLFFCFFSQKLRFFLIEVDTKHWLNQNYCGTDDFKTKLFFFSSKNSLCFVRSVCKCKWILLHGTDEKKKYIIWQSMTVTATAHSRSTWNWALIWFHLALALN